MCVRSYKLSNKVCSKVSDLHRLCLFPADTHSDGITPRLFSSTLRKHLSFYPPSPSFQLHCISPLHFKIRVSIPFPFTVMEHKTGSEIAAASKIYSLMFEICVSTLSRGDWNFVSWTEIQLTLCYKDTINSNSSLIPANKTTKLSLFYIVKGFLTNRNKRT